MKKLLTCAALAATMFTVSAQSWDIIDAQELIDANPSAVLTELEAPANYDPEFTFNNSLTYKGESGVAYELSKIALVEANEFTDGFFRFEWNYNLSSSLKGNNASEWLESIVITVDKNFADQSFQVMLFGSETEFADDDRYSADLQMNDYKNPNRGVIRIPVDMPVHYFALSLPQGNVESIEINWTNEKPVPTVAAPEISSWQNPVEVGGSVSVKTATLGATIYSTVYLNGELAPNQPGPIEQVSEWGSASISLPGKAGDKVKVEAYATKEGWTDSEKTVWETELAMGPAPSPTITKVGSTESYISYVIAGEKLQISVLDNEGKDLEGAKVTYSYGWNDWDDESNSFESESVEAAAPVELTVPENAPVGLSLFVKAVATCEGYRESYKSEEYMQIVSDQLEAPYFTLEDGATVKVGGSLAIRMPSHATEIHYTVNDGEEQTTSEWEAVVPVTEEITVVAWATGEAPFKPSEKVTVTVAPEKFEDWMDVITSSTFGMADETNTTINVYNSVIMNDVTNVSYDYRGKFWTRDVDGENVNCFYMDGSSYVDYTYIRNTVASVNTLGQEVPIKNVQIDPYQDKGFFLFLSNNKIETITDEMTAHDYAGVDPLRITVVGNDEWTAGYNYDDHIADANKMISLDDIQKEYGTDEKVYNDKLYFAISPVQASQSYYLVRAIVGYTNGITGVEGVAVDALQGVDAIYNLNGVKVNAENLTPGIYVRVVDGKTTKVVVK